MARWCEASLSSELHEDPYDKAGGTDLREKFEKDRRGGNKFLFCFGPVIQLFSFASAFAFVGCIAFYAERFWLSSS